jgi:hypothetical protein
VNLDIIRKRIRNGFEPFALETAHGRRFEVPHPEFIAVGRNVVAVLDRRDYSIKIDALHIISIDDIQPRKRK